MNVSKAIDCWMEYHNLHSRKNTVKSYESTVSRLGRVLGDREPDAISSEDILAFLTDATDGSTHLTKRTRYAHLRSFFYFIKNNLAQELRNPCDSPMLRNLFRTPQPVPWKILDKEAVDEVIFRTTKPRNRLILELMARGGMRISEVLKLTPADIEDRKLILRDPKSGRGTGGGFRSPESGRSAQRIRAKQGDQT
jgi:integrase/recombinase XerD